MQIPFLEGIFFNREVGVSQKEVSGFWSKPREEINYEVRILASNL